MPMLLFVGYALALGLAVAASIAVLGSLPSSGISVLPLFDGAGAPLESSPMAEDDEADSSWV